MDERTALFYARSAKELAEAYDSRSGGLKWGFEDALPPDGRVLDIGCGSGRDLCLLLQEGWDAYGVEPCDELRREALARHPELEGRLIAAALPDLGRPFGGEFDGVTCSAVLMHLPFEDLPAALLAVKGVLKPDGRLLLSVCLTRQGLDAESRDVMGRLFTLLPPERWRSLFEGAGFQLLKGWTERDAFGREGITWFRVLLER